MNSPYLSEHEVWVELAMRGDVSADKIDARLAELEECDSAHRSASKVAYTEAFELIGRYNNQELHDNNVIITFMIVSSVIFTCVIGPLGILAGAVIGLLLGGVVVRIGETSDTKYLRDTANHKLKEFMCLVQEADSASAEHAKLLQIRTARFGPRDPTVASVAG